MEKKIKQEKKLMINMKIISFLTFFSFFLGCKPTNDFNLKEVESITIVWNLREIKQDSILITDKREIKKFTDVLNKANKEPVKFLADYRLDLKLKNRSLSLLVKNNLLSNQGITYKLKDNLSSKILKARATN